MLGGTVREEKILFFPQTTDRVCSNPSLLVWERFIISNDVHLGWSSKEFDTVIVREL